MLWIALCIIRQVAPYGYDSVLIHLPHRIWGMGISMNGNEYHKNEPQSPTSNVHANI